LSNLGAVYFRLRDLGQARRYQASALQNTRACGDRAGEALACWNLGLVCAAEGDTAEAIELMQRQVTYLHEIGHPTAARCAAEVAAMRDVSPGSTPGTAASTENGL
jgi:hypothetical protein